MVDSATQEKWSAYESDLPRSLHVVLAPRFYLGDIRTPKRPHEPSQAALDNGIRWAVETYQEGLRSALDRVEAPAMTIECSTYVPPALYRKGGPVGAPFEILHLAWEAGQFVLNTVGQEVLGAVFWEAFRYFRRKVAERGALPAEEARPVHSPQVIRLMCAAHARQHYPAYNPAADASQIRTVAGGGADYPVSSTLSIVIVPAMQGSIVYLVDAHLCLRDHFYAAADGGFMLDPTVWSL